MFCVKGQWREDHAIPDDTKEEGAIYVATNEKETTEGTIYDASNERVYLQGFKQVDEEHDED